MLSTESTIARKDVHLCKVSCFATATSVGRLESPSVSSDDVEDLCEEDSPHLPSCRGLSVHVFDLGRLLLGRYLSSVQLADDVAFDRALDSDGPSVVRCCGQIAHRDVLLSGEHWRLRQDLDQAGELIESVVVD